MTCKEICLCHKGSGRLLDISAVRYVICLCNGMEYCCGSRSRIGPRNIKNKAKLRKQKKIRESKNKKRIMLSIQSTTVGQFQVYAESIICNWFLNIVNTIIIN